MYEGFDAASPDPKTFAHPVWVKRSVERLQRARGSGDHGEIATVDSSLIVGPILACLKEKGSATVIDVGGNLGQLALSLTDQFPRESTRWHIVERTEFLDACAALTQLPDSVTFHKGLESIGSFPSDIVHFGSSLQYIDDWSGALHQLSTNNCPSWFVVADAMTAEGIPTFVTRQKYYDSYLVSRFIKRQALDDTFADLGYELAFSRPFITSQNMKYYPETNLPPEYRIEHPLDLIYLRRS